MGILFSLIGLIIMLAIGAGVIVLVIFMARKAGLLKQIGSESDDGQITDNLVSNIIKGFKWLKESLVWRFGLVVILITLMTVPLGMVKEVVNERSYLHNNVKSEVASTWGQLQKIRGPSILIPYTERFDSVEVLTDKDGNEHKKNKTIYKQRTVILLPEALNIDVSLSGQTRKRSIYEALVYSADIQIQGEFIQPDINELSSNIDEIHWDRAWFSLGISDTQAINKVSMLRWNSDDYDFEPGTKITHVISNGFHAPLDLSKFIEAGNFSINNVYPFSLEINVNGSDGFYFNPFGKTTNVNITSDWPHPSFQGNVLPDQHNVTEGGFDANWTVPHLARNYPQLWTLETQEFDIDEFTAGVNLFESVSLYSQITRAIKYGVLFLVLTYVTFLLFEMGIGRRLHVIQYGVIGLAISMFYLTLLSLAEHAGFFKAYLSAAAIIIAMISCYVQAALKNVGRTSIITILLIGLYSLLYSLLRLEDYALLAGVGLLLVVLAVMMYLTSNVAKPIVKADKKVETTS